MGRDFGRGPLLAAAAMMVFCLGAAEAAPFKVGMAVGGNAPDAWQKAQGDVARARQPVVAVLDEDRLHIG